MLKRLAAALLSALAVCSLAFAQDADRRTIPRLEATDAFRPPARSSCSRLTGSRTGDLCWDTDDQTLYAWNGTAWVGISSSSSSSGNAVRNATSFAGSDMCAKIQAALSDLPATGGTVDARGFEGTQTCASNPFNGNTKKVEVLLGAATITTSAQWALNNGAVLKGIGRDATTLKASATFPTNTALVRLGQGLATVGITGTRIENMGLDCNTIAGSIGIYSTEINELSGGNHLLIQKFMGTGIKIQTSGAQVPANYIFDDMEIYSDTSATAADGIYISSGSAVFRKITVVNLGGGHVQPRGIYINAQGVKFEDVNVEYATDAFYLDTNATGVIITNADAASTATTLIHIVGSGSVSFSNLVKGTATNVIKNDYVGTTITDAFIPLYSTTTTTNGYQVYSLTGRTYATASGGNVEALVAPNWVIKSKQNPPVDGASVSAVTLLDNNNDGWAIRASSPTAAPPGFIQFQKVVGGSIVSTPFIMDTSGNGTMLGNLTAPQLTGSSTALRSGTAFPGSPAVGDLFVILDDSASGACDSAAGGSRTICRWSGSAWQAVGDGNGGGGALSDGDKGDVTVSVGGTVWTIDNSAVTLAKMADLAQDQFIGRTTASTGVPQTATITAAARSVLDDTTVAAMVDTLGGATATGTGGLVRATSPTLTTPNIGIATGSLNGNASSATTAAGVTQGASPSVTTAGQVAVDTTEDQFLYYGAALRALPYKQTVSFTLENPADPDNFLLWKLPYDITVTNINCIVDPADSSESVVIDVQERNTTADSPVSLDTTITCTNTGASDDGALSNPTLTTGEWMGIDIGAVTGTVTQLAVTITYTVDRK